MTRRSTVVSFLLLWHSVGAFAVPLGQEDLQFLRQLPPLHLHVDDNFTPLSRWNPQKQAYEGIAVDLFQEAARRLGVRYELDYDPQLTWSQKVDQFRSGEADGLIPVSTTNDRAEVGVFSVPFFDTRYVVIVSKSSDRSIQHTSDLAGRKVGVIEGTAVVGFLRQSVPTARQVWYPTSERLYQALRDGQVDCILQNLIVFQEDRYNSELFDLIPIHSLEEWPRHYAFYFTKSPDMVRFVGLLNRALAEIDTASLLSRYERGAEALILRYTEQKDRASWLLVVLVISLSALVLLVVLLWNHRRVSESEARFRALVEASFGGISIHDHGHILECNDGLVDLTGFSRQELIGMDGLLLIAPGWRDQVLNHIRSGFAPAYEVEGLKKDGTVYPLGIRGKNIVFRGKAARVTEFIDLTDQKDAEAETRRAKQRYDDLVTKIPIGIYQLRSRGRQYSFEFVSPRMAELLGVAAGAVRHDPGVASLPLHPDDRSRFDELNFRSLDEGTPFDWTGRCLVAGVVRWFHITSSPEVQGTGDILWSGTVTDITDLREAQDRAAELLAEKDLVLREVHHRIKNNMSIISGLLTLQAASLDDSAAIAALEDAKGRIFSMMVLYDKLYLLGGNQRIVLSEYLPDLVEQILDHFPNRNLVTFHTRVEEIILDSRLVSPLGIIVNELLTNAMKYAFLGRVAGNLSVTVTRPLDGRVRLTVEDDGLGLAANVDLNRSGFGLTLVELLAQNLKATLQFETVAGTRVTLEFPG